MRVTARPTSLRLGRGGHWIWAKGCLPPMLPLHPPPAPCAPITNAGEGRAGVRHDRPREGRQQPRGPPSAVRATPGHCMMPGRPRRGSFLTGGLHPAARPREGRPHSESRRLPAGSSSARTPGGTRQVESYSSTMHGPSTPPARAERGSTGVSIHPNPRPW